MKKSFLFLALTTSLLALNQAHAITPIEQNIKTVTDFYILAFNKHQPEAAMQKYVGDRYIQHNPFVADGKKPFIDFFTEFFKTHPHTHVEIKRVIAEGDLVMLHLHSKTEPKELGTAVVDIFRLEKGKIVEHWDVGRAVPEKSANSNTVF